MSAAPWLAPRWQEAGDPPEWAEHNARLRYEARRTEIHKTLMGAVEKAGEDFAEMGLDSDDAGGWIENALELADWGVYFDDEASG